MTSFFTCILVFFKTNFSFIAVDMLAIYQLLASVIGFTIVL